MKKIIYIGILNYILFTGCSSSTLYKEYLNKVSRKVSGYSITYMFLLY